MKLLARFFLSFFQFLHPISILFISCHDHFGGAHTRTHARAAIPPTDAPPQLLRSPPPPQPPAVPGGVFPPPALSSILSSSRLKSSMLFDNNCRRDLLPAADVIRQAVARPPFAIKRGINISALNRWRHSHTLSCDAGSSQIGSPGSRRVDGEGNASTAATGRDVLIAKRRHARISWLSKRVTKLPDSSEAA